MSVNPHIKYHNSKIEKPRNDLSKNTMSNWEDKIKDSVITYIGWN